MTLLEILAAASVLAGAVLQSAVGFGFALACAPLVFAALGPQPAVGLLTLLAVQINLMTLATERRRPEPLPVTLPLLAWSVPGMVAGVAVLRSVEAIVLQILLTVTVFATLLARRRAVSEGPAPAWATPASGLAAGGLTTTTGTAGPAVVLLLLGRGHSPARVRDTLTLTFLGLSLLGAGVLAVTGTSGAVPDASAVVVSVPLVAIGQLAGRPLFARLASGGGYERVLTLVLVASALAGLVAVLV